MSNGTKEPTLRFASGLILPPPEIKCEGLVAPGVRALPANIDSVAVIDRTALFVARSANPPMFEDKIRENQRQDPKFSFLNPADPYHAYYRHRMDRISAGEELEEVQPEKERTEGVEIAKPPEDVGVEPPQPQFVLDIPNITSIDLDTMKLTALFTARRGRGFLAALSQREGRNYQFDFLRPNHSLFGYFNRLVEQYQKVLYPSKEMLAQLHERAQEGAQWKALEQSRKYARWERLKQEKDKKRQDDQEAEKLAFAEIDWHDYAIVQTIEFTAADANTELPPPMSLQEVENMTLAQKRMAAMIMENTADEIEAHRARQAAAEAEAAAAVGSAGAAVVTTTDNLDEDAAMEESEDEDEEAQRKKREEEERMRELERAKAIQASANVAGPMKIKTDYVPKLGSKKNATLTTCAICGQQIPVDELDEHMRIELLDPKWKSQRDALEARKVQASELMRGANVVTSLKNLASTRVDIFGTGADEERRKREEEEERARRKEREKVVWDGHTATKVSTMDKYSTNVNFDEQIAAIHRAKGLGPQEPNAIGPGIGPAAAPPPPITTLPPPPASLPAPPTQATTANPNFATATVSSGPQPASAFQPPPVMLPPLHYQGLDAVQPFGFQPPPPGMHPPRMPGPPPQTGTVRSADQVEGLEEQPQVKRQKIAKLPGGALYPEADWIAMHPYTISLSIQLPSDPSKPEWKLDGQVVTVSDLPLTLLVSTLRDRFLQTTGSTLPASRIRLSFMAKMLTNSNTIAFYNLEDEDLIVLSVSAEKKRR
ncbi:Pre-mRNA splicing factor PRP21 like protein-domain-containing protein [Pisolithus orientalis]|uniref:Pre-mRNA splicing factor PRP21 like protein-domain-containing protein n=1 Tax=Pisolithus orientalis TaxID=936130 RepID=UPI002223F3C9|nr:Pre-mRNA splicing factor PRP21 like protein-domain-containing protein [Pisolithus orientalis]KAI6028332.1 Pre-mRNA splicing factor PRP21 like protein-domain-containing protein [Pisolithus orientalis]